MKQALEQAREGRIHVLKAMLAAIPKPRDHYSPHAPQVVQVQIRPDKIGMLIGPGGKNIRRIQEETGATIEVEDSGVVKIYADNITSLDRAREQVEMVSAEAELGKIYNAKVMSIKDFGAFVELVPGLEALVHISELADGYVSRVTDVVRMGDMIPVKVILIDDSGRVKGSRKAALIEMGQDASAPPPEEGGGEFDEDGEPVPGGPDGGDHGGAAAGGDRRFDDRGPRGGGGGRGHGGGRGRGGRGRGGGGGGGGRGHGGGGRGHGGGGGGGGHGHGGGRGPGGGGHFGGGGPGPGGPR
jgi:polyribonucleotide nucleotidyltransferase